MDDSTLLVDPSVSFGVFNGTWMIQLFWSTHQFLSACLMVHGCACYTARSVMCSLHTYDPWLPSNARWSVRKVRTVFYLQFRYNSSAAGCICSLYAERELTPIWHSQTPFGTEWILRVREKPTEDGMPTNLNLFTLHADFRDSLFVEMLRLPRWGRLGRGGGGGGGGD